MSGPHPSRSFGLPKFLYDNIVKVYKGSNDEYLSELYKLLFKVCDGTDISFEDIELVDLIQHLKILKKNIDN